jgi:hypothetical protein
MERFPDERGLQEHGCGALWTFAASPENRVKVAGEGGISGLVRALNRHQAVPAVRTMKTVVEHEKWCHGFAPENKWYKYWSWFMIIPLMFTGTIMPYRLAFHDFRIEDGFTVREEDFMLDVVLRWTVDLAFILDMILCFFAGFYDEDGNIVSDLVKIRGRYMTSLFAFDFVACLPPEIVYTALGATDAVSTNANKLTRLPRVTRLSQLTRLARMGRLSKLMRIFKVFRSHPAVVFVSNVLGSKSVLVMTSICGLLVLAHILACLWYLVTSLSIPEGLEDCLCWVDGMALREEPPLTQWAYSMHYIFTVITTVGFGDISPTGRSMIIYTVVTMFIGVIINSVIVGEVISIVSRLDSVQIHIDARKMCVHSFLSSAGIRDRSARKVLHWSEFYTRKEYAAGGLEGDRFGPRERQEFQTLVWAMPEELLDNLTVDMFAGEFKRNLFFLHANISHMCVPLLLGAQLRTPRPYATGDFVYEHGSMPLAVYFISKGIAAHVAVPTKVRTALAWLIVSADGVQPQVRYFFPPSAFDISCNQIVSLFVAITAASVDASGAA